MSCFVRLKIIVQFTLWEKSTSGKVIILNIMEGEWTSSIKALSWNSSHPHKFDTQFMALRRNCMLLICVYNLRLVILCTETILIFNS